MRIEKPDSKQRGACGSKDLFNGKINAGHRKYIVDQYSSVGIMMVNFICQCG